MAGRVAVLILGLGYPFLAYATLELWGAAELGMLTLLVGAARIAVQTLTANAARRLDPLGILLLVVGLILVSSQQVAAARLYPVLVNLGLLGYFAWTLRYPPSAVERIAWLTEPDLPDHAIVYTRRVTAVWCVFFVVNGSIALYTALWTSIEIWTLYNGLLAYLLMGLLFAGEYLVRRRTQAAHGSARD